MLADPVYQTNGGGSGNYGGGSGAGDPYNYGGAGGAVGGYSYEGTANLSGYTGVGSGSGYNSFTPTALPNVATSGVGVLNNANFVLSELRAGLVPKEQVASIVGWIHAQLISLFGTKDKSLKQYQAQAISIGEQIQSAADSVLYHNPTVTETPTSATPVPTNADKEKTILEQLQSLLGNPFPTSAKFEAPPNLYQFTPTNQQTGATSNMPKIIILIVVIAAGYWLYKKYA